VLHVMKERRERRRMERKERTREDVILDGRGGERIQRIHRGRLRLDWKEEEILVDWSWGV
jgi:hypothetical protein